MSATYDDLSELHSIGDETAFSIIEFFNNEENIKMIKFLKSVGVNMQQEEEKVRYFQGYPFNHRHFIKTKKILRGSYSQNGGNILSGVSKNLNYLITGQNPGSKLEKAKQLGVKIIDEEEFLKMLEKGK